MIPVDIPPGVVRTGTRYQTKGRYWDANLVRFIDGMARPVGGWTRATATPLTGKVRAILGWRANNGQRYLAAGASNNLYASTNGSTFSNITPAGLATGFDDAVETLGYGGGGYGLGPYGTARTSGSTVPPTTWQLDTWGENLVACHSNDGRLFEWALNTATPAAVISNAPTSCRGLIVSEQRHLIALGAGGNPRRVQWSGKENNTVWTPAALNEAGSFDLQTTGTIQRGVRVRGQILIVTDNDAHVLNYIGQPFIFARDRVGSNCGTVSPSALVEFNGGAAWMSDKRFWLYDGATVRPLPSDVADYVFNDINYVQSGKVAAGHNGEFGEVWWFYPSRASTENDRYVVWNYRENLWTIGALARTAWLDKSAWPNPLAVGADSHVYRHEEGWLNNGATRVGSVYLETGALDVGAGERFFDVRQILPDEAQRGEVSLSFTLQSTPNGATQSRGPYLVRADGYTDARFSARQVFMRLDATVDDDFKVGVFRFDAVPAGRR